MKDPLTRLLSLLLVASVACARPTPAHPGASASPDAVKMPAILLDVPASPVPGRPLAYDSVEAAGTALAVVLTAPSALHPTPSEDSIRQPGTEVVTHPSDLRLNLNNPAPTAVPAHHAQFIADAVDAPAVFSNTVRDGYQVAVRAVVGRRGTVDVHVATAGTGTPDSPLIAKHPTLPKMIGYSIILLAALLIFLYILFSSKRVALSTLRPRGRRALQQTRPSVNATTVQMAPTLRHPPSRRSTWETRELDAPAPPYNAAVPPDYAHTPNALDAPPPAYDDGGRHRTRAVYAIPPRF